MRFVNELQNLSIAALASGVDGPLIFSTKKPVFGFGFSAGSGGVRVSGSPGDAMEGILAILNEGFE